eukprot:SAG11_NODE_216_length_12231_cov_10.404385_4_plen_1663_part_00
MVARQLLALILLEAAETPASCCSAAAPSVRRAQFRWMVDAGRGKQQGSSRGCPRLERCYPLSNCDFTHDLGITTQLTQASASLFYELLRDLFLLGRLQHCQAKMKTDDSETPLVVVKPVTLDRPLNGAFIRGTCRSACDLPWTGDNCEKLATVATVPVGQWGWPLVRTPHKPNVSSPGCPDVQSSHLEHPTLWFDRNQNWRIIYRYALSPWTAGLCGSGVCYSAYAHSRDGALFTVSAFQPHDGTVSFTDNRSITCATRERPQMIFADTMANRTTAIEIMTGVNSVAKIGPMCNACKKMACCDFKYKVWTYLQYQQFAVAEQGHTQLLPALMKTDDSETPLRFQADQNHAGTSDTSWVHWVVVSSMDRTTATDAQRAEFLDAFDPDLIDWDSGLVFNRGQVARARGVASSSPKEYEYEESLQFGPSTACSPNNHSDDNYTVNIWGNNGVSRDEHNQAVHYRQGPHLYMELNAPRWKSTIKQGNLRSSIFGDTVIQDNIGSGINKAGANYDDHSNARFLRWLARRCAEGLPGCSPKVKAILTQSPPFNIRDHIRLLRTRHQSRPDSPRVAMEPCGSTRFGPQELVTLGADPSLIKFHDLRCLTTVDSNRTSSGTCVAAACVPGNVNQQWKFDSRSSHLISSRTDCAGNPHGGCCLSISSGRRSAGTIVQLFGCEGCPKSACAFEAQPSKTFNETVLAAGRLCVTPGVQPPAPSVGSSVLIQDVVLHEFIRHGFISALSNWDDIAAAVRRAGRRRELTASGKVTTKPVLGVWGNQWGMMSIMPVGALMSQTSDVTWVEQSARDSRVSAWSSLTYKIGDAAGGFRKPVWTIEYGKGRSYQIQLAEAAGSGGLMDIAKYACPQTPCIGESHAQFVGGKLHRHLFVDRRRRGQVALVWSVPSLMWRRFSSLSIGPNLSPPTEIQHVSYLSGIARVMEDSHVLYEVLMLGHPDVFNDTASTGRISTDDFETIVLAGVDAISDSHVARLMDFVRDGGGHLIVVGGAVGSNDEELRHRRVPALAALTQQPGKGRVSEITDSLMASYLGGKSTAALKQIAQVLQPAVPHVQTTLPASVRINSFSHSAGPMTSLTFTNYGSTATLGTVSLLRSALECHSCSLYLHNLPLVGNAATVQLFATLSEDQLHLHVNVTVGALAVLSIGAPGEEAVRGAAADLRKNLERLKIASRTQAFASRSTDLMGTAERLLSQVQGPEAVPCASSVSCPSARSLQSLSSQLAEQLNGAAQNFTTNQSQVEIMNLAEGAVLALDFGHSPTTLPAPWRTVTPATRYSSALGYGWSANSTVHWSNSSTNDAGLRHPFSEYIAGGGAAVAEMWVDLKPGEYIVTVVVGLWDRSRKSAVTEIRDAAIMGNYSQLRLLAPAQRIHSGQYQPRTFRYRVAHGVRGMRLAMVGHAVGPEISQVNQQAGSDTKCVSAEGWLVNAIIVQSPAKLGSTAHASLTLNTLLRSAWINDWAAIGPFNDSNTTGLDRPVSTAEGDTRLMIRHRAKNGSMVAWQRSDGNGLLAIAALLGSDDALGSAAILQTSVFCAVPTNATAVLSTSGTGTLSLHGAAIGTDEIYAGLLQQEVVIDLSFHQGWSTIQLKSLSHLAPIAAWSATVALITRELPRRPLQGCKLNACADPSQHLAPMCRSKLKMPQLKTDDPRPLPRHLVK